MKTVIRTLFYQFFLLYIGISVGFIANAEYIGWKSAIVSKSVQHIFFPIKYDQQVENFVLNMGRMRLATKLFGSPFADLTGVISDERVWGEEYYDALYHDPENNDEIELYQTRVRWKPWEYYYEYHSPNGDDLSEVLRDRPGPITQPKPVEKTPEKPNPPAPSSGKVKQPHEKHWPHHDEGGRPVPGPVIIPDHDSHKPWWDRS